MTTTTAPKPHATPPAPTAADRCDRCAAAALVITTMSSGLNLYFCKHHYEAHEPALAFQAAHIHDYRDRLTAQ